MPFCPTCGTSNIAPGTCLSCAGIVPDVATSPVHSQVVAKNNSGRRIGIIVPLIIAGVYGANQFGRYGSLQLGSSSGTNDYLRPALGDYNSAMHQAMLGGTSCSASSFTIKGLSGSAAQISTAMQISSERSLTTARRRPAFNQSNAL